MAYGRDVGYSYDQVVRDITFLLHQCADYNYIYGDNDYWTLLCGPYYEFFEEGESIDDRAYMRSRHPDARVEDEDIVGLTNTTSPDDLFLQSGSVLLFFSMLRDYEQGSGYAFGTHEGVCRHPLPTYIQRLLRAYRRVRFLPKHPTRPLYVATVEFLGLLDHPRRHDPMRPTKLESALEDTALLAEVRNLVAEDWLMVTNAQFDEIERALCDKYIHGYFAEGASVKWLSGNGG